MYIYYIYYMSDVLYKMYGKNYLVTNAGQIINIKTQKELSIRWDKKGYGRVRPYSKTMKIHRIVALLFIPNPENKPIVDHIDRNKRNNAVSNLRWVTDEESVYNRNVTRPIGHRRIDFHSYYEYNRDCKKHKF